MSESPAHQTVLLDEAVDHLLVDINGKYIDGTFGRGSHTQLILNRFGPLGELMSIDRDADAIAYGRSKIPSNSRFFLEHAEFSSMKALAASKGWGGKVSGVILDLGVSSPQLDEAARGFSFMRDGPLDMRMNQTRGRTAAEWIANAKQDEISVVLKVFGEERFAKRIARAIV